MFGDGKAACELFLTKTNASFFCNCYRCNYGKPPQGQPVCSTDPFDILYDSAELKFGIKHRLFSDCMVREREVCVFEFKEGVLA
jgi:hypothetical protein